MYKCYQNPVQYNQLKKSKMESICMNIFSLTWIKSKQCNNTCSKENISLQRIQHLGEGEGGLSTFNRKQWVRNEWPICSRDRTVSSLLVEWQDVGKSFILDRSCAVCLGDSCPTHFARVQWCNCTGVVSNQRKGCICLRRRHQGYP